IRPHPSPLPKGEGIGFLAPFSPGRRVGEGFAPLREEGNLYLHSATLKTVTSAGFVTRRELASPKHR
ncbi:MAG: hypothetical protein LH660_17010, partial [Phormidesmis sp. CAN_BIN36]|nr:hypothetical protein [Phormidesmis sp. CAN_BIN36]